jgi:hypothetical protein
MGYPEEMQPPYPRVLKANHDHLIHVVCDTLRFWNSAKNPASALSVFQHLEDLGEWQRHDAGAANQLGSVQFLQEF